MKIAVAQIKGPRGFKGELAASLYRPNTETLKPGLGITLQKEDATQECVIESVKFLRGRVALKLTGIDDEETALGWRGADVLVEKDKLASLKPGEYYHFNIEGAEVFEENGAYVGKVTRIEYLAANDILIVETENGEAMIPFVKAIVKSVEIEPKRIIVNRIEGLF